MDATPNRYGQFFDAVSVALCAVDGDGTILRLNHAMAQLTGWQPADRLGQPLAPCLQEAIPEPGHALWWTVALSQALSQGKTIYLNQPTPFRTTSGPEGLADVMGIIIATNPGQRDGAGALVAIYGPEILASTAGVQTRMFAALSHEFGSPMTNIAAAAELLAATLDAQDERQHRLVGIIQGEVARLQRLVAQLVSASPAGKRSTLTRNVVTLRPLLRRVAQTFDLHNGGHRILLQAPPDLPYVWGDADAIQQILANLIDHALRHSPAGDPVHLRAEVTPGEVRVCIAPQPPGPSPAADRTQPAQPYPPVGEPHRSSRAQGLGLSISTSLVQGMGGRLWHDESGLAQPCFCFTLARADGADDEHETQEGTA